MKLLIYLVVLFLLFWGTSILFSIGAAIIYIPTNNSQGFPFHCILSNRCYFLLFELLDVRQYIIVLIYISLMINDIEHLPMSVGHLYVFIEKSIYLYPLPFLNRLYFLVMNCMSSLCILNINTLSDTWFANIFFHSIGCPLTLLIVCFDKQKFVILM